MEYQEFPFNFYTENAPPELERISPDPKVFVNSGGPPAQEVYTLEFSGSGEAQADVQAVDVVVPATPAPSSTSGCEAADFAGFAAGNIALIQRGTCFFEDKVANAAAAGASAVIIFNEGQPGRTDPAEFTLTNPAAIPAVFIGYTEGVRFYELDQAGEVIARVATDTSVRGAHHHAT